VPLFCDAAAFHCSHTHDEDSLSLYIAECLVLLSRQIDNEEIAKFATRFAFIIAGSTFFKPHCRQAALPIFIHAAATDVTARAMLIDSFVPYLPRLETDPQAQQLFLQVLRLTDSPSLWLLAATILRNPIPFASIGRSFEEIMAAPITSGDATNVVKLFGAIVPTASRPLLRSILATTTELLRKFELAIEWPVLAPIYVVVKEQIGIAAHFLELLINIDPGTKLEKQMVETAERSLEAAEKAIAELVPGAVDIVAMTTCKELVQLRGLIGLENPPSIYPFASLHQMLITAKKTAQRRHRTASSVTSRRKLSSPRKSTIWGSSTTDFGAMELAEIRLGAINLIPLGLVSDGSAKPFAVSADDFIRLPGR
jgi:hypothetical protein